jgi:hypothetical protein
MKQGDTIHLAKWLEIPTANSAMDLILHKGCFGVVLEVMENGFVKAGFEVARCGLSVVAILKPDEYSTKSVGDHSIHTLANGDVKVEDEEDDDPWANCPKDRTPPYPEVCDTCGYFVCQTCGLCCDCFNICCGECG